MGSGREREEPGRWWPWSMAAAAAALAAGWGLSFVEPWLALGPLAAFLLLCGAAPFFPAWGFYGPTVTRGRPEPPGVALTFDDGPDPSTTGPLLDLLRERGVRAGFFVVGRKVEAHPELVRRMTAEGHEVGNHSHTHDVLLMLRGAATIARELDEGSRALESAGVRTRAFRSPVGVVGPRLFPLLRRRDMVAVGFSRRAGDFGNRRVAGLADRLLAGVRSGDVVLLHDGPVEGDGDAGRWLEEMRRVLDGLAAKGLAIRPLSEHIDHVVNDAA